MLDVSRPFLVAVLTLAARDAAAGETADGVILGTMQALRASTAGDLHAHLAPPHLMPVQVELGSELTVGDGTAMGGRLALAGVLPLGRRATWQPFVGLGLTASWAAVWHGDAATARYWVGPELRLGMAARPERLGSLRVVGKAALVWFDAPDTAADVRGLGFASRPGARFGLAVAVPGWALRATAPDPYEPRPVSPLQLAAILLPTELELTVSVIDGERRSGVVLGYAF